MTNDEKIIQGFCVSQTNAKTGEVTIIPYTDIEIEMMQKFTPVAPQPNIKELKAQLEDLQAKLNSL